MKKLSVSLLVVLLLSVFVACEEANTQFEGIVENPKNLLVLDNCGYHEGPAADVFFAAVEDFGNGATRFRLQSSTTKDGSFVDVGASFDTDDDEKGPIVGFTVPIPSGGLWLALRIEGGTYDGQLSNRVYASYCSAQAQQTGYSLDEGMYISGVMSPNVGHGLRASFTVMDLAPAIDVEISDPYTFQWYRVDPNNWEDEELISGATETEYITTSADRDHLMLIKATGNSNFPGGYGQIFSIGPVQ